MGRIDKVDAGRQALAISVLIFFTVGAALLRAIGLNSQLWCDEIVFVVNAVREPTGQLLTRFFYDTQHTFYALLAQGSVAVFGDHPWVVRLPAMVFGTLAVPALYWLGVEVTNRFEALAAAGLLAVSYHHVWFSQNARGYTALMLAAVLATSCLVRGLKQPGWGPWLLYSLIVALGAYTHLTMVFLAVSHATLCGWLALRPRAPSKWQCDWKRSGTSFVLAGLLTILLYAPMFADVQEFFLHKPSGLKQISTPSWALSEALIVLRRGLGENAVIALPVLVVGGLITICGLWSYFRQDRIVFVLFALPVLVTVGGALVARGTMYPRFFFFLAGFALLVVSRGIAVFIQGGLALLAPRASPIVARYAGIALVGVLMACSAASLGANYRRPKQDFEGPIAYIEAHRTDGEPVVTAVLSPLLPKTLGRSPQRGRLGWDSSAGPRRLARLCLSALPWTGRPRTGQVHRT
jgi:mannosyltransferase